MAKCLRLAISSTSKLVQTRGTPFLALKTLLYSPVSHTVRYRHLSNAVLTSVLRQGPATLTSVKPCTCGSSKRWLQTEVDKELSKFLEKEISYEQSSTGKSETKVKGVEGFEVKTRDGEVILTRNSGNEVITVKFSVNGSVDSEGPLQEGTQGADPEMVSRPPFNVEICKKGDGRTLSFQCNFISPDEHEDEPSDEAVAIYDQFEIQEVALHKGEWEDTVYSVQADIMDGNLYDLLMDMLDERGINEEFASQLIDFSTSYEHSKYVEFLKNLKSFAEK